MATEPSQTNSDQRGEAATPYVDGFVIAVPRDRIDEYERIARDAAAVWREHGALGVAECVADDVPYGELTSFPRAVHASDDETVIFSQSPTSRARPATRSTRRSWPIRGSRRQWPRCHSTPSE